MIIIRTSLPGGIHCQSAASNEELCKLQAKQNQAEKKKGADSRTLL
jgi:hypothetical protein